MPISCPPFTTMRICSGKVSMEWPGTNQVVLMPKRSNSRTSRGVPTSPENMPREMSSGEFSPPYEPSQPATASTSTPNAHRISLAIFQHLPSRWYKATLMCALCGVLLNDHWAEQEGGRRGRTFRVGLVNRVLDHYGLELDDWAGRVYVLRDRKGRAAVVDNLGALWPQAAVLAGRPLDPLD